MGNVIDVDFSKKTINLENLEFSQVKDKLVNIFKEKHKNGEFPGEEGIKIIEYFFFIMAYKHAQATISLGEGLDTVTFIGFVGLSTGRTYFYPLQNFLSDIC